MPGASTNHSLRPQQPTLYLLCGLPGAGKSTLAKKLDANGHGVVLNADSWTWRLYPDDAEAAARDGRKSTVEQLQWQLAEQFLAHGASVILDWGLWTLAERDDYRSRAAELGAASETILLDEPVSVLKERLAIRNANLPPGTFHVSTDELEAWALMFEPPTENELGRVIPR